MSGLAAQVRLLLPPGAAANSGAREKSRDHRRAAATRRANWQKLRKYTQHYIESRPKIDMKASVQVDMIYDFVDQHLLRYQSYTTGLFPRFGNDDFPAEGHCRDSIYCALACWATGLAYQRLDDDRGRQNALQKSAAKTMRGILECWMHQVERLERFKRSHSALDAIHVKFDMMTGKPLQGTDDYGHLQIDVVALYLIVLVQMTAGGVQIIYTHAEVMFIQNLVFYIERAYRTPDYGIWERGTRYNDGNTEMHASSMGVTKAALEAINSFNVYGSRGTSGSVIYVDIDAHNRNRTTFESMLPRESNSKNTDAALLATIGWPVYAAHDKALIERTTEKVLRRLDGKYGLKRHHRDGYRCPMEQPSRRFYEQHETKNFDGIESQWPMFYLYLCITACMDGNFTDADKWWKKAEALQTHDKDGHLVLPECYCVPGDQIEEERRNPNSVDRFPSSALDDGNFLWAQALLVIAQLLRNKLVHSSELDPIYRHLPASQRPKLPGRHSAFHGGNVETDPVVQVALIAESSKLQQMLATYGINTQTPHEVEPVQIWPSGNLVSVFEALGRYEHPQLNLTGRPSRPFGVLSTSKVYRVFGDTVLCFPISFEISDFYTSADPLVVLDNIKNDLQFVAKRWKLSGRPTYCVILREQNVRGEHFSEMMELLVQMKNGVVGGRVRVRVGRVQNLISAACVEHVDFADAGDLEKALEPFKEVHGKGEFTSLRDISATTCLVEVDHSFTRTMARVKSDGELVEVFRGCDERALRTMAHCVCELWDRHGPGYVLDDVPVRRRVEQLYRAAEVWKNWWVVRFCAGRLKKTLDSLAPSITTILVKGKQVTLGMRDYREKLITSPMSPKDVIDAIYDSVPADETKLPVFQQEVLVGCAQMLSDPHTAPLFDGILTVRVGWLVDAMQLVIDLENESPGLRVAEQGRGVLSHRRESVASRHDNPVADVFELSPIRVKHFIKDVLSRSAWQQLSPLQQRKLSGAVCRMPPEFHDRCWRILARCTDGIMLYGKHLPQQPTLTDMTEYELNFVLAIEKLLSVIKHAEYRQLMLELMLTMSTILQRNPELKFKQRVDLDALVKHAFRLYADEHQVTDRENMTPFYELPFQSVDGSGLATSVYLARAVTDLLLRGGQRIDTCDNCRIS